MEKQKKWLLIGTLILCLILFVSITYAFVSMNLAGTKRQVLTSGTLSLELFEDENNLAITNALPMYDEVGMLQDAFTFRLINESSGQANYILKLEEIAVEGGLDRSDVKYGLTKNGENKIDLVSNIVDNIIDEGTINGNETIEYELRLWVKDDVEDITRIEKKSMRFRMNMVARQEVQKYTESILNGTDPVLSDNLIPVTIEDDGTVKKASLYDEWYNYEKQRWANAVVLENNTVEYSENEIIPEENIESYFVWIPKYSYQLWDLGNYSGLTSITGGKVHTIPIKFGTTDTSDASEGECTTPGVSGSSGNCKVGDYMTHPAFLAFDSTGFWVGKFESGYKGATSTTDAEVNSNDSTKLQIKPNVYSWRNITLGNAFKVSYDYLREDESHMMKNTEWGAVAYLQHSGYGSHTSVRINNNSAYITGYAGISEPTCGYNNGMIIDCNKFGTTIDVTLPYNTEIGYSASTTGNISGIYDMSGSAYKFVMGYNMNSNSSGDESGLVSLYSDFFTNDKWNKYYDKYSFSTDTAYDKRILGDATGEMGPFGYIKDPDRIVRIRTSWYEDYGYTAPPSNPWFNRGGHYFDGNSCGMFSSFYIAGDNHSKISFRTVLTPFK